MANRTYLVSLPDRLICPGYREDYDAQTEIVSEAGWYIPFLWLSMFRESDLITETFPDAGIGGNVTAIAPVVLKEQAASNLDDACELLQSCFAIDPNFFGYFEMMRTEVLATAHSYLTIDWVELDEPAMHDEHVKMWHLVLSGFGDASIVRKQEPPILKRLFGISTSPWMRAVRHFSEFDPKARLPSARAYLDGIQLDEREATLHERLLPAGDRHPAWLPQKNA